MGSTANKVFVGVRDYTDFNEDNDLYGEHDFGSLKIAGQKIFWKIDYYVEKNDDERRQILIELFENIIFKNNAVSVSLKDRAELIAMYSSKTRELLGTRKSNDRTFTNSENNRGQNNEKAPKMRFIHFGRGTWMKIELFTLLAKTLL